MIRKVTSQLAMVSAGFKFGTPTPYVLGQATTLPRRKKRQPSCVSSYERCRRGEAELGDREGRPWTQLPPLGELGFVAFPSPPLYPSVLASNS